MGYFLKFFMWGYQEHFCIQYKLLAQQSLEKIGVKTDPFFWTVGVRAQDVNDINDVCISPEGRELEISNFEGLLDRVESIYQNHEQHSMFYSHGPTMEEKPMRIRQSSVHRAVAESLLSFDKTNNVTSICGEARRVGNFYVVPVIQTKNEIFVEFPPLPIKKIIDDRQQGYGLRSFINATIQSVLEEANTELTLPEPGKQTRTTRRDADEIVRRAAEWFMRTPALSIEKNYFGSNLFETLNRVSSLMYEGAEGYGRFILTSPDSSSVKFDLKFASPVPLRDSRWVRKVLQMANTEFCVISDSNQIYGLGRLSDSYDPIVQDAFVVEIISHYYWQLSWNGTVLIRSHYESPELPQGHFDKAAFLAQHTRFFPTAKIGSGELIWQLLLTQIQLGRGSMMVIAADAESESLRLSKQGTNITPTQMTPALFCSVSSIDGTILLDPNGICFSIGVILDGFANDACMSSRGSRYNSGVRYVGANSSSRFAIVASDDRTIDIIPAPRQLISKSLIEQNVKKFVMATVENYHEPRNWLDKHRFYINEDQCRKINGAILILEALPKQVGIIYLQTKHFFPNDKMNDSFLVD